MAGTSNVSLRRADRDDASDIAAIWSLGWRDGHLGFVSQELVDARTEASFRARASERVNEMTVALVDGVIAGFVLVVGDEVEQVYVAAPHRGTGVAGVLMREAEHQVRANGHSSGWLAVVAGKCESSCVLRTSRLARRGAVRLSRRRRERVDRGALPPV